MESDIYTTICQIFFPLKCLSTFVENPMTMNVKKSSLLAYSSEQISKLMPPILMPHCLGNSFTGCVGFSNLVLHFQDYFFTDHFKYLQPALTDRRGHVSQGQLTNLLYENIIITSATFTFITGYYSTGNYINYPNKGSYTRIIKISSFGLSVLTSEIKSKYKFITTISMQFHKLYFSIWGDSLSRKLRLYFATSKIGASLFLNWTAIFWSSLGLDCHVTSTLATEKRPKYQQCSSSSLTCGWQPTVATQR